MYNKIKGEKKHLRYPDFGHGKRKANDMMWAMKLEILDPSIALEGREFHIDFVVKCVVLTL